MKTLVVQHNKISGPDATCSYKIEFSVDESQSERLLDFVRGLKKGTELLLMAYDTNKEENEIKDLVDESPEDSKKRLNKRMHVLVTEIAENKNMKTDDIKTILKKFLIEKKYIKESTAELDVKGYAAAIYYLSNF